MLTLYIYKDIFCVTGCGWFQIIRSTSLPAITPPPPTSMRSGMTSTKFSINGTASAGGALGCVGLEKSWIYKSVLQNIVSFCGLFCKRDDIIWRSLRKFPKVSSTVILHSKINCFVIFLSGSGAVGSAGNPKILNSQLVTESALH